MPLFAPVSAERMVIHPVYADGFPDDKPRVPYLIDGVEVPSVTTVLASLPKSALTEWKKRKTAEAESAQARAIGTLLHEYIEAALRVSIGDESVAMPDIQSGHPVLPCIESFHQWRARHKVVPIWFERRVFSREHGFAGTADCLAMVDDMLALLDWKSSKQVHTEYELQVAAYWAALCEQDTSYNGGVRGMIVRCPKNPSEGVEEIEISLDVLPDKFQDFLAVLRLYKRGILP